MLRDTSITKASLKWLAGTSAARWALLALNSFYDFWIYGRRSGNVFRIPRGKDRLRSQIVYFFHKFEKGMALPEPRKNFGKKHLAWMLRLLQEWKARFEHDDEMYQSALLCMKQYRDDFVVGDVLGAALIEKLDDLLSDFESNRASDSSVVGGTRSVQAAEFELFAKSEELEAFLSARVSVRQFDQSREVSRETLRLAVRLAQRAPSVCNRQSPRLHIYSDPDHKAKVLSHQNGNAGFGHTASHVLLVTSELESFNAPSERNEPYIDGALFAMALIYGLQSKGVSSCCLNLCLDFFKLPGLRRDCGLSKKEVPLFMLAVGYPSKDLKVAASQRLPIDQVVSFH